MRKEKWRRMTGCMIGFLIAFVSLYGMTGCSGNTSDASEDLSAENLSAESLETADSESGAGPASVSETAQSTPEATQMPQQTDPVSESQEENNEVPGETVSIENYLVNGEWKKLKDVLRMQPAESQPFGDTGEAYEIDGFYVTWSDYLMEDEGIFTMENTGSTAVNFYGVKVGDKITEADTALKENGWTALDDGRQYIVIFNGKDLAIDFDLDENQVIRGWYLCNWPEGDFSENFVGLENQQIGGVPARVNVYEGEYMYDLAHTDLPVSGYYTVMVDHVTEDSFDFTIYYVDGAEENREVVFRTHTAIFEGDGTYARYHGEEYQLKFTFPDDRNTYPDAVDMQIEGYEPVEGMTFSNNAVPGHEFS